MEQQNPNPITLSSIQAHATIVPTDDDLRAVLLSSKQDAICKHQAKKDLLAKLCQSRKEIFELADFFDATNNSNIKDTLTRLIPDTTGNAKKLDNKTASTSLVGMFEPMRMLRDFSVEQSKAKAVVSTRGATNGTASRVNVALKWRDDVMEEVEKLFRDVERKAREEISKKTDSSSDLPTLAITRAFRDMVYCVELAPMDPTDQKCPWCNHMSLNHTKNLGEVVRANQRKMDLHQEAHRVWNEFLTAKADADASGRAAPPPPKNPKKPSTYMTRAPSEQCGNLESPVVVCTCSTSQCCQVGSDRSSTCPWKCRVDGKEDGPRYEWVNGRCLCPRCQCTCIRGFNLSARPQLALHLAQGQMSKTVVRPEIETQQFIQHAMATSAQSTHDTMAAYDKNSRRQSTAEERAQVESDIFWNHAAHNINKSGPNMAATTRAFLGGGFGTGTLVTLPNGSSFNTRFVFNSGL
jgi:hypothetical protein